MAERETGVGTEVVAAVDPGPRDLVAIFSNSGRNPYPVEIAEGARARGAVVVALTSVGASQANPPRGAHRLYEVADVVLDTMVPPGDVSSPAGNPVTSPLSTLACCALWTEILADTVELDPGVRLWRSANQTETTASTPLWPDSCGTGYPNFEQAVTRRAAALR